jgi:hypothetical protein
VVEGKGWPPPPPEQAQRSNSALERFLASKLLEGDGAFAERDLVVKQFAVVCEPLVQRVGHSVKRGREWRVGAMHHSLGCQAQMRPHRGITRRGIVFSAGVFLRQKFVQTVWMRAHPVQHRIGVEGTVCRVAHGAKVTLR